MSKRVLSLALKVTGDASGVRLTPVERALQRLGEETEKVGKVFDKFAKDSELGREAQAKFAEESTRLTEALKAGTISSQEYANRFAQLADSAQRQAAALEEGRRITEATRTEEEKRTAELERLRGLLEANAIDQQTYNRAVAEASGANRAAAESAKERAAAEAEAARATAAFESEAARIRATNLTAQERFDEAIARASELRTRGLLTEQEFNRELERQAAIFARNAEAADSFGNSLSDAGDQTLKFNELSGVLAILPGPLGSIAGRISGITSASQGLSRVFSGGLSQGVSNLASSLSGLLTPTNLALTGIAAFGAAANAVVNGLTALEDRVEKLGNTAAKLGVSFQFIQNLEESARRSGTSIDAVSSAFGRLQNSVLGVDEESKKAQAALASIGVTAEELQTLSPEQQYDRIGKAIAGIEDPAKRTAAATALFGRAGADLIPFFNNIDKATNDIERFGAAISDVDRSRIDSLGDSFDSLFVALRSLGQSLLLPFTGLVDGLAKAFSGVVNIVTAVAQAIGAVLGPILDTVGRAFGLFGDAVNSAVGFFRRLLGGSSEAAEGVAKIGAAAERTAEQTKALEKAFDNSSKALDTAIAKAGQFGQEGFDAAKKFEQALADLKEQADDGELDAEQYARGVANATREFEKQIDVVGKAAEENKKLAQSQADAIEKIIETNLEQQRIEREFDGDPKRLRAAENLVRINEEIARVEQQVRQAREAGNQEAASALAARLATLDQVAARESDIASGAEAERKAQEDVAKRSAEVIDKILEGSQQFNAAVRNAGVDLSFELEKAAKSFDDGFLSQKQLEGRTQAIEEFFGRQIEAQQALADKAQQQQFDSQLQFQNAIEEARRKFEAGILNKEAFDREVKRQEDLYKRRESLSKKVFELENQLLERQFAIERERAEELANTRSGAVKIGDIRESGGLSAFFDALKEDPAIAEAKKQTQELQGLRRDIQKLEAEKVDILAGTG